MDYHIPVLQREVLSIFNPKSDQIFIDATLGNGGHTLSLLRSGARVYGLDADPENLLLTQDRLASLDLHHKFTGINCNFNQLLTSYKQIAQPLAGVLFDLGLSCNQQKSHHRGFSFDDSYSLDMRLDPHSQIPTAEEIINTYSYDQLYDIFSYYAQEKLSKPLTIAIIRERQKKPIKSGKALADIIRNFYHSRHQSSHLDPATKIFLALRIYVNQEFDNLKQALDQTLQLNSNCIIIVISFHSGEDRLVKQFTRKHQSLNKIITITHRPIVPTPDEIAANHLSRSAVLRSYKIN